MSQAAARPNRNSIGVDLRVKVNLRKLGNEVQEDMVKQLRVGAAT